MMLFRLIYKLSGSTFLKITHIRKKIYLQKIKKIFTMLKKQFNGFVKPRIGLLVWLVNMSMDNEVLLAVLFIFAILIFLLLTIVRLILTIIALSSMLA
jgi:hypothetical protein